MSIRTPRPAARCLVGHPAVSPAVSPVVRRLTAAAGIVLVGVLLWASQELTRSLGSTRASWSSASSSADWQVVVALVLAGLAWLVVAWGTLATASVLVAKVPGALGRAADRVAEHLLPGAWYRGASLVLGIGLATGAAPWAQAAAAGPARVVSAVPAPAPYLPSPAPYLPSPDRAGPVGPAPATVTDPLLPPSLPSWTPDRPAASSLADAATAILVPAASRPTSSMSDEVVVHRGDTLWTLAARHLGPTATPGEIARAWPRWYQANRQLIGPDPGLIYPGERLTVPR
ncbi:MAG: LysM peptidoglycan-binding domain-containing protein [Actinomycetes bacterium]